MNQWLVNQVKSKLRTLTLEQRKVFLTNSSEERKHPCQTHLLSFVHETKQLKRKVFLIPPLELALCQFTYLCQIKSFLISQFFLALLSTFPRLSGPANILKTCSVLVQPFIASGCSVSLFFFFHVSPKWPWQNYAWTLQFLGA